MAEVEHAWAVQQRARSVTRRCSRCLLWETPYTRERPCRGRPLTTAELTQELAAEVADENSNN